VSRTYRNRHSTPHGWTVRDGGEAFSAEYPNRDALREAWRAWRIGQGNRPAPAEYRRSFYCREAKDARIEWQRKYRARVRNLMRHGRYEDIAPPRRTSGWLSW
jgi:hypothetical protein